MPPISGIELCREIRKVRTDIPIILSTGYSTIINEESAVSMGINGFIHKPYRKSDITPKIRDVLDNSNKKCNRPTDSYLFLVKKSL
jgi:CheY-like chemotaxis protein